MTSAHQAQPKMAWSLLAGSIHRPNAHTTQPLNFIFGRLNATTLDK
jgi:hypothetical protein